MLAKILHPDEKKNYLCVMWPTQDRYIAQYWPKLARFNPEDKEELIGLPKPYLVPSQETGGEFNFEELYYWDSYFMIQGILDEGHKEFVLGILEDLISLFERFKDNP